MKKRFLCVFLVLAMMLTLIPAMSFLASAVELEPIKYIERTWDGEKVVETEKECTDYIFVSPDTTTFEDGKWYVLKGTRNNQNRIVAKGNTHLILPDGCNLYINNGIEVTPYAKLNIYGQNENTGKITALTTNGKAAIGGNGGYIGGSIVIHGGTIDVKSDLVTSSSSYESAVIGGSKSVDSITIYNGNITATAKGRDAGATGAAIGSGKDGNVNSINIYGGVINASSTHGAAIGSGRGGAVGTINIKGGIINASTNGSGSGIGGGDMGNCSRINFFDGTVTAKGSPIAVKADEILFDINTHAQFGKNENEIAGELDFSSNSIASILKSSKYAYIYQQNYISKPIIKYIERDATSQTCKTISDYEIVTQNTTKFENDKYYVVIGSVDNNNRITVSGTAHLILLDGKTLNAKGGIGVDEGNKLFIYGQCEDSGILNAGTNENVNSSHSALGGSKGTNAGDIAICGGTIKASATNQWSAGIGGSFAHTHGYIDIYGGTVNASSYYGAGIGAGADADGNRSKAISIYGGTVNASSACGAGIGTGRPKIEGTNSLNNKLVTGHGGLVKFYGGNVTASSSSSSAIGGANYTAAYEDGSSKTFYGNPGILYMEPSITLYYGNDKNTATNTVTTTSLSQNVGANVDRQHYATYTTGASETHVYAPATCTEPRTCMVCGATDGEPLGHEFTEQGELISAADCTHGTLYAAKCVRCEETNGTLEIGSPLGHDYDALYVVKEATETTPAEYHAVCTRCGDITDSYIPQTPWEYAALTIIQEGVLLERGATFKHNYGSTLPLSECDIYVNGSVVATIKNGKSWTAPECLLCTKINRGISSSRIYFVSACDFTEATCTEAGVCVYCGAADGEAPGHTWTEATCTEPAVCSACGAIGEALGHDFTAHGTLISAADCTHAAVYTAKCVRCEETNGTIEVGSPLGHKYELIKKLSDSPLTYTAECLVCGEQNEAYEVPDKYYSVTDKVTTASMQVGRTVKPNSVITLDALSKAMGKKITVYIDGIKVYEDKNDYTTPNQCLKCVYKNGTTLRFETDCLFIRANCTEPKTCVYCGNTVGEKAPHNFENGVCTVCGMHPFEFGSFNLVLSGELGMNFTGIVNDMETVKDGYMLFEIGTTGEQKVYLSDLTAEDDGRYIFRCNINVLQMADTITVSFHYGDVVVGPRTTSVTQYLKNIVAKNSDNEELAALAHAIENYGHYAQIALQEVHGFTLGEDGKYQTMAGYNDIVLPDAAELAAYKAAKTDSIAQITRLSRALALDHGTDILLYFNCEDGYTPDITVTDKDGNAVACSLTKDESGRYVLTIPNISAHKLGDFYTVSVDGGAMSINISALSYAYSILNNSANSEKLKYAVAALYDYYRAAIAYQAAHE